MLPGDVIFLCSYSNKEVFNSSLLNLAPYRIQGNFRRDKFILSERGDDQILCDGTYEECRLVLVAIAPYRMYIYSCDCNRTTIMFPLDSALYHMWGFEFRMGWYMSKWRSGFEEWKRNYRE